MKFVRRAGFNSACRTMTADLLMQAGVNNGSSEACHGAARVSPRRAIGTRSLSLLACRPAAKKPSGKRRPRGALGVIQRAEALPLRQASKSVTRNWGRLHMEAGEPVPSSGNENAVFLSLWDSHSETLDVLQVFRGRKQHVRGRRCVRVAAIKERQASPRASQRSLSDWCCESQLYHLGR